MSQTVFPNDVRVNGTLSAQTVNLPSSSVQNQHIIAAAGIDATKLQHQHALKYVQDGGTNVVSATVPLHVFRATAEIVGVEVVPIVAPDGGDLQYTVDVQKGNAGSAFATILTGVVTVDDSSVDRTPQEGTLSTTSAADGDTLQVVVTASGSTGTQGQGVLVLVTVRESP